MADLQTYQAALGLVTVLKDAIENPQKITDASEALAAGVALTDAEIAKRDEYNLLLQEVNGKLQALSDGEATMLAKQGQYASDKSKLDADIVVLTAATDKLANDRADFEAEKNALADSVAECIDREKNVGDRETAVADREEKVAAREDAVTSREGKIAETLSSIQAAATSAAK